MAEPFARRAVQLGRHAASGPLSEAGKGNAIHGFVRFINWNCIGHTTTRVDLGYVLHPRPGYPFTLALQLSYEIAPDGLTVTTTARNIGSQALPFASGQHPYLAAPTGLVDACTLEAPARRSSLPMTAGSPAGASALTAPTTTPGASAVSTMSSSMSPSAT
jgi:aldose 1-epimerase